MVCECGNTLFIFQGLSTLLLVFLEGLLAGQWEYLSIPVSDVMPQTEQKKKLVAHLTQLGLKEMQVEFKGSVCKV